MNCTNCGYENPSVVYTRHDDIRNQIIRRRECNKCGLRFSTMEQLKGPRELSSYEIKNRAENGRFKKKDES